MKFLVSNNTFSFTGGSETYAYCVISALKRHGYDVDAFTTGEVTMVGDEIRKLGVNIFTTELHKVYDVALSSHLSTTKYTHQVADVSIQTCHGIYPALEQPDTNVTKLVSISQEVNDHIESKGLTSTTIHNGVDCDRFKPIKPINKKLKKVLSLAHDQGVNKLLKDTCRRVGIDFEWHNKYINPIFNIEDKIQQADLVVTLGRGAYESMACGRPVLVLDNRGYSGQGMIGDGILTIENIDKSLENNCSGRALKKHFNEKLLIDEFQKYNYELGEFSREYALDKFNIDKQLLKYIELVS